MKHWWKILALSLVCGLTTLLFAACGPEIDASILDEFDHSANINLPDDTEQQNANSQTPDEQNHTTPIINTDEPDEDQPTETPISVHQHQFSDWKIVQDPTCTETGLETRECTCGETESQIIAATGHQYNEEITTPATCLPGEKTYTCHCGDTHTEEIPANGQHDYTVVFHAPTCTENGYTSHKCRICGDELITDRQPATGHQESTIHPHKCETCGQLLVEPIQDLTNSVWLFNEENVRGLEIHFLVSDETPNTLIFNAYKYKDINGMWGKDTTKVSYSGTYRVTDFTDVDTEITTYTVTLEYYNGSKTNLYTLTYHVENTTTQTIYGLTADNSLFINKTYNNITLNFTGYEL